MENGQKSAEWEAQVFNRSRTREEYVKLVATLIWKLRDYNKKVYFIFDLGHIMKTQMKELLWSDGKITGPVIPWHCIFISDKPIQAPRTDFKVSFFKSSICESVFSGIGPDIQKRLLYPVLPEFAYLGKLLTFCYDDVIKFSHVYTVYNIPYTLENCMDRIWR